jgi:hypothetical protein
VFDQEIEALRDQRKQLIRKMIFGVIYVTLALWAVWLVYIAAQQLGMGEDAATFKTNVNAPLGSSNNASHQESANAETIPAVIAPKDNAAARKVFQQQLVAFDATHKMVFTDSDFLQWLTASNQLTTKEAIVSNKDGALTLFASSRYQDAIVKLTQTDEMATALTQSWHQAYEDKLNQVQQAYNKENVKPAELYLNQALAIKSNDPRGLSLQQQLKSYPRVAELLATLNVAKIENNLQKQADTLQQIIDQDSTRTELVKELDKVTKKINDQVFSQAINNGLLAIEQQKIAVASAAYRRAKAIYPQRVEVISLQKKIAQQQATAHLQTTLVKIKQAAQADDWEKVLVIAQGQRIVNTDLQAYKKQALYILQQQKTAAAYLARPERLQDQGIRQQAKDFITNTITLTLKSPRFAQQIEQLSNTVDNANRKQTLRITSDGKTDIWVLSVGHVGRVEKSTEKTIQLYPGQYTVEGRCDGYRNKQQSITLSSSTMGNIYLVCDERI